MGLFDFFTRGKAPPPPVQKKYLDKKVQSLAKRVHDKKLQPFDRDEALQNMIAIGTHEAAIALLKRFSLSVDPSIVDQEEKQVTLDGIVSIGLGQRGKRLSDAGKDAKEVSDEPLTPEEVSELRDAVVDGVREYCQKAPNLNLALKVTRALLDDTDYEQELLRELARFDTEYTRNVEPKINILTALEELHSDAIRDAVHEYLDDVNETVRFHAVQTTFVQDDSVSLGPLVGMVGNEESVRIKNKVCDGIMNKAWKIPINLLGDWNSGTTDVYEYDTSADGIVKKA
jgi:hypothetical protein